MGKGSTDYHLHSSLLDDYEYHVYSPCYFEDIPYLSGKYKAARIDRVGNVVTITLLLDNPDESKDS